jgi:DNA-binding transcriptional ArsR family regulator
VQPVAVGGKSNDPQKRLRHAKTVAVNCDQLPSPFHDIACREKPSRCLRQHLDVLGSAGLVETRREGRYKFHYLNTEPLEHIADRWLRGDKEGST